MGEDTHQAREKLSSRVSSPHCTHSSPTALEILTTVLLAAVAVYLAHDHTTN